MAFQQIKAALAQADLDQRARILALADRLDLMTTAESILADWERRLNRHWDNTAGAPIDDTATAADASVLKPVQDGRRCGSRLSISRCQVRPSPVGIGLC
jgi:hypothetical protein